MNRITIQTETTYDAALQPADIVSLFAKFVEEDEPGKSFKENLVSQVSSEMERFKAEEVFVQIG